MDEVLLRYGADLAAGGLAFFSGVAPPAAASAGEGVASSAHTYGDVPKLEQIRKEEDIVRAVRAAQKLSRLWNDMVDLGMLRQVDGRWIVDPTLAPTFAGGVTGHFN